VKSSLFAETIHVLFDYEFLAVDNIYLFWQVIEIQSTIKSRFL